MSERKATSTTIDKEVALSNGSESPTDSVAQIRDLIFGDQMSDYEGRFKALEAKLIAEIEAQRTALDDAINSLKAMLEKRIGEVEDASVQRSRLAGDLEQIAQKLRDG